MDIPTASFLCTCVVTGGVLVLKYVPTRQKANNNGNGKQPVCPVHDIVMTRLKDGDERFDTQLKLSKSIGKLVLAIAAHANVPIDKIAPELKELIGE